MEKEYVCNYNSKIGKLTLISDGENITGLFIKNIEYSKNSEIINMSLSSLEIFKKAKIWLDCYFSGQAPDFIPNIKLKGTEFRKLVWKIIGDIPYGEVITYGDIAKMVAKKMGKTKMSSQAVGGAVGSNPISIIVPCHRVVGAKGNLTGYGGGLDIKVKLLTLEGIGMDKFHMPK
ncbi:methylated-DNA--[protein]-cysteine S-methyltransferase [Clostridium felsineum]|uniref:Methylated-DNA--protein-cysteine methyltransferase n=1 Tax=Clostridium felsineum TaxID=36839 RepID=A0A1S8MHI9_9CLOT|nr:methylated-DNA--[protein]-cysteine S-methyltransferase [Clostridium felsineum]URZ07027.1 Methylated-DNA--protein-cysteine methyltransferase [Clostridium felsineum]URZ12057.1 Methylated-DNA--protein-cysteine methyltransferase [Clostridium felsineum]URZ16589.1 Methylated-DNA--protein-cysteine methyltransferase [Clostridium felsineum DSM 794]